MRKKTMLVKGSVVTGANRPEFSDRCTSARLAVAFHANESELSAAHDVRAVDLAPYRCYVHGRFYEGKKTRAKRLAARIVNALATTHFFTGMGVRWQSLRHWRVHPSKESNKKQRFLRRVSRAKREKATSGHALSVACVSKPRCLRLPDSSTCSSPRMPACTCPCTRPHGRIHLHPPASTCSPSPL
uniref:Uncharacterized protein n=1 Tax=Trichogramma kaykai TaxID=54128 RepID=A0ABD2VZ10_9HYME